MRDIGDKTSELGYSDRDTGESGKTTVNCGVKNKIQATSHNERRRPMWREKPIPGCTKIDS